MARTDNLPNFLTDVATAIKTKTGDNTAISPSSFDTKINSIKTASDGFSDEQLGFYTPSSPIITNYNYLKRCFPFLIIKKIGKIPLDFSDIGEEHTSLIMLSYAFYFCLNLKEIDVSLWNVSTISYFGSMFGNCSSLKNIDLSAWNISTSSDADNHQLNAMFNGCTSLKNADLSCFKGAWNVNLLMNNCTSLEKLDIRNLDLVNCTNVYTDATSNFIYNVPTDCEIVVADQTQKTFMNTTFPDYTNVVIAE